MGCSPPPVGGCLLAAGQEQCGCLAFCSIYQPQRSAGTAAAARELYCVGRQMWSGWIGWVGALRFLLHTTLFVSVTVLPSCGSQLQSVYVVRKTTILNNWQVVWGTRLTSAYQFCVCGLCTSTPLLLSFKAEIPTLDRNTRVMGEMQACVFNNPAQKVAINACVKGNGIHFPSEQGSTLLQRP